MDKLKAAFLIFLRQWIGAAIEAIEIDLNDQATIAATAEWLTARYGRLDILVNNARIVDAVDGPPSVAALGATANLWRPISSALWW